MELTVYLNKKVYIILANKYYYTGKCIEADKDSITIIDKKNQRVSLRKEIIMSITEIH